MPYATCPECDGRVRFVVLPDIGDMVQCETCGSRLEVVALDPIELDWPEEVEADEDITVDAGAFVLHPLPLVNLDDDDEDDPLLTPLADEDDEDDLDAGLSDDDDEYSGGRGRHVH